MLISQAADKKQFASRQLGGSPSAEEVVQKVAELEYLEQIQVYMLQRASEYPPYSDYIDGVVKGDQDQINAYIAACQAVKDKYPKVAVDQDELDARKAEALAVHQLQEYTKAMSRLSQYILSVGSEHVTKTEQVTNQVWNEETVEFDNVVSDVTTTVSSFIEPLSTTITVTSYDPTTDAIFTEEVSNPLIVSDEAERAEAQAIVDATPQAVIDTYKGE